MYFLQLIFPHPHHRTHTAKSHLFRNGEGGFSVLLLGIRRASKTDVAC